MRIDTAKAMPNTDAAARSGCRITLRSTIRPAVPRCLEITGVSKNDRRYRVGTSGRMASAGGTLTARRTAVNAPAIAARSVITVAPRTTLGGTLNSRTGKRKKAL